MRIDKFLKVSRIIKRRTLAKEVCDGGRIQVNGRPAKAGTEIKVGDRVVIQFPRKRLEIEIKAVKDSARVEEAPTLYEVLQEEFTSETE
ncbi:RNA-binding S4 domain-containing protein [Heliorestis convoluta]|uniref:RQC P-site tRNA stabilizing factor n=1 Tax=Heliorestis convoluta TaxID=356322 RepID=A0A5Q2N477_9FIRM|nr:RNA-binding S4 domain-containing protein [Heliorestis convoluta]QGG48713.1 RNA-binding S4 domain-containing protein [Heliorestis convoluta]